MQLDVKIGRIGSEVDTTVIIGLFKEERLEESDATVMESALHRYLRDVLAVGDFKGEDQEVAVLYPLGQAPPGRVILVGLGSRDGFSLDTARRASGIAVRRALKLGVSELSITVHGPGGPDGPVAPGFELRDCAQATVEGLLLGAYRYDDFKTGDEDRPELESVTVVTPQRTQAYEIRDGIEDGQISAEGTTLARDLSNAPGNAMTPRKLAAAARKMAGETGLNCRVLTRKDIVKERMGALLAVNAGSEEPPRFIVLEHGEASDGTDTLVFIGKGITFDSGGISIKSSGGMEEMKHDMSGAAAVIGAMRSIALAKPSLHVVGLVPATENLPDGKALKPGDIITTRSGKTIEVINTDAEGRLVLADALEYAERYNPTAVIDLATLTGACVVALGYAATGMMGNDDGLQDRVRSAGETAGERVWPLPLWKDYHDQIKSHVADVKNTGGRWAGALTAGAFLAKFVERPWAHLDIAGTAYTDASKPYCPTGATGVGVRLLLQLVKDWKS
ncbi:MAG: leucyl aminopeptidase [Gemmatimonadetes bacterium]|nr:leucyl aminopeptidase [Gemmatimonadota bacterium]MYH18593.1 leucyl aminopeptidase [Gemmatimonadota bacterium]